MQFVKKILKWSLIAFLVIFIFLSVFPYLIPLKEGEAFMARRDYFPNSQIDEFEGVWVHYRVFEAKGNKKGNILFLHGFSGSTFSWRKNVDFFQQKGYQVLCIDLPPFGYSDRLPTWNYSIENKANLAWKVAEKVDNDAKWILAGHSMGAGVALAMGQIKPEKTEKIACIGGLFFSRRSGSFGKLLISYPPVQVWAEVLLREYFAEKDRFKEILQSAYNQEPDEEAIKGYLQPLLLKGTATAILKSSIAESNFDLDYNNVASKMVVIWGEKDMWVSPKIAKNWHKNYPDVPFITIKEAGHCPMETHAEQFNEFFEQALSK
ncbi:MAG: alpha/beta hydrolase [Raineya sp.]